MSELPETVMADAVTIERWHRCTACDVTWRSTSAECWACESTAHTVPGTPPPTSDTYSPSRAGTPAGTPLTRHGSRLAG